MALLCGSRPSTARSRPSRPAPLPVQAAPLEFVGTPLRLQALVDTLCGEMAEAFASQGRMLPPWRKPRSMLSKWFDPEEMPGASPPAGLPPPAPAGAAPPAAAHPQLGPLQAAGQLQAEPPPLSPFELAQAQVAAQAAASAGRGVALSDLAAGRSVPSLLQQQAAAALAERNSGSGGSQEFYEALAMHKESMRRQQAAAQGPQQQQPAPARRSPSPSAAQQQQQPFPQQHAQPQARQQQPDVASSSDSHAERSNKPRRRRQQQQGQAIGLLPLWGPADGLEVQQPSRSSHPQGSSPGSNGSGRSRPQGMPGPQGGSAAAAVAAGAAAADLQASGSWSDLSTIMETRSNASSPATAALLAATNAALMGTSCASRRSVGSAATLPRRASPPRMDEPAFMRHSSSAVGSFQHTPDSAVAGFALTARAGSMAAAAAAPSAPPSIRGGGGGPSPTGSGSVLGGGSELGTAATGGGGSGREKKKAVSLLARSLKSMGQKQTWANLLPVRTAPRLGPGGVPAPPPTRSWPWRGGSEPGDHSRRSGEGSSRRGRRAAAQAAAAQAAAQQQLLQAAAQAAAQQHAKLGL